MVYKTFKASLLFLVLILWSCQSKTSKYYDNLDIKNNSGQELIVKRERFSEINTEYEIFSLASWNIRDLGRTKNSGEIALIAGIINDFDIVLIQEIVGKDPAGIQAVAKIIDELNRLGSKWDYYVSNPTKSPSAKMSERYGFLWKTSKISVKGKPYLDLELEDLCYREPYIGNFTLKNQSKTITLVNYHSRKHDDSPEEEIVHLKNYKERLESESIIIAGDFNLDEQQPVWDNFYSRGFVNALENTPTTLKTKCKSGNYLNHSIDNIFYTPKIKVIESGSLDFVKTCDNLSEARNLSDHLPVYIRFQ